MLFRSNIIKNTLVYYMNFYNEVLARRPKTNEYEYDYEEDVIKLQALNELTFSSSFRI